MRTPGIAGVVIALFLVTPAVVFAQASITGTVRDTSGAVLPGVTVEASSPALIEKVRTATTDGNGQYRIVDLRAGEYTVTFTLPGFSTVKREGVALEGSFTATINIDLRVGELTETITVTGESPIVDVQSVRRQMVLDNDIISAIPSSRSYNNLIQLIPNSVNQAGAPTDVQVVPGMVVFGGFGGRSNEGRVNVDGISVGSAFNGAGVSSYIADVGERARDRDDHHRAASAKPKAAVRRSTCCRRKAATPCEARSSPPVSRAAWSAATTRRSCATAG